jgi:hypothetical protein
MLALWLASTLGKGPTAREQASIGLISKPALIAAFACRSAL